MSPTEDRLADIIAAAEQLAEDLGRIDWCGARSIEWFQALATTWPPCP